MGNTVETAGKHVSRALDRLTNLRGRPSHVVTAVSLGTMLTSEMAKAARSLLTASLATDSLSVTSTLSHSELLVNALLTMNTTKTVATLALLALPCLPLGWQQ
ncbi:hypothetical protein OAG35_00950 [bacterium]|nr:hypothetical protein [bacterium]